MSDPVTPRMPRPKWLAYAAGMVLVLASLVLSFSFVQHKFLIILWTVLLVLQMWPLCRSVGRRILAVRYGLKAPPAIAALRMAWSALGITAREVATPAEIAAFERTAGIALPMDLRHYFARVNGTEKGECGKDDGYGVGFWHLNQVRSFADTRVSDDADAHRTFAFADWSFRSAVYGVRLSADSTEATPIFANLPSGRVRVAASFSEFVARYFSDPRSVLWPDFDVVAVDEGVGTDYDGIFICSIRWEDVKAISIIVVRVDEGSVQSSWVIAGDNRVAVSCADRARGAICPAR